MRYPFGWDGRTYHGFLSAVWLVSSLIWLATGVWWMSVVCLLVATLNLFAWWGEKP